MGPMGAGRKGVPGPAPTGLPRFLASQRRSSASSRMSSASLVRAALDRGMPAGSRSPQSVAVSTPRS
eukprot:7998758-Alexandrium_andersonii.AAC.1